MREWVGSWVFSVMVFMLEDLVGDMKLGREVRRASERRDDFMLNFLLSLFEVFLSLRFVFELLLLSPLKLYYKNLYSSYAALFWLEYFYRIPLTLAAYCAVLAAILESVLR